jgi:hypothetical protein
MATPGVARQISIWTSELAKSRGYNDDAAIYEDSEFSPQNLIKMTLNRSIFEEGYYFIPQDTSWAVKASSKEQKLIQVFSNFIKK